MVQITKHGHNGSSMRIKTHWNDHISADLLKMGWSVSIGSPVGVGQFGEALFRPYVAGLGDRDVLNRCPFTLPQAVAESYRDQTAVAIEQGLEILAADEALAAAGGIQA